MTHEDIFLQDVIENHDDDTPRRIYADWLMDRGDAVSCARGEFIHVQCELARLPSEARPPADLLRRERELLSAHGREWGTPFLRFGCRCWEYRRGFVAGVGLPATSLLNHGTALFRQAPIREMKLYEASGYLDQVAECPVMSEVKILDLEKNELGDADFVALSKGSRLTQLRSLLLWSNRIGDSGLAGFVVNPPPRLETLDLSANIIGDDGIIALAESTLFTRLRRVDLSSNRINDSGARALAQSRANPGLIQLGLAKNPIGAEGTAALRQAYGARVHVLG